MRPGRCLAQIEVGPLDAAEAAEWLGRPIGRDATLAELYALRSGNPQLSHVSAMSRPCLGRADDRLLPVGALDLTVSLMAGF